MNTHTPSPRVLETFVTDDDLTKGDVPTHASRGKDVPTLSKQVMKAYRRAKKVEEAQDAKSRQICAVQRAKREGTALSFEPVTREESAPKVQTLLSDF